MASETSPLVKWSDLPKWQRDNEYILTGYRPATTSLKVSLASIFSLHNESVNIHSHAFGGVLFLILPIYSFFEIYPRHQDANWKDILVFGLFFFGVSLCFFFSATFHVVSSHGPRLAAWGNQLDYLGIVLLMWGATIPSVYYGFFADSDLQITYWTVVSLLATMCCIATMHPKFRLPTYRAYRAAMYASLGLSAVIFIIHGVVMHGWALQKMRMSLDWMLAMACLNLTGGAIYAARIPEKWYPQRFDIFGSSHQILHVMVILAGLAHMKGLFRAFDFVHSGNELRVT